MNYEQWNKVYEKIIVDLQLNKSKDETAAEILNQLMNTYRNHIVDFSFLQNLIEAKTVFVFGAAPSLEKEIKEYKESFEKGPLIASDGATSALLKHDIFPDVIVTDLDGVIADQIIANKKNSILVVHAHGDNIDVVQKTIPKIEGQFLGTVQTNPSDLEYVKNFGGFTDGDRAVFFADFFHPKEIILVGFDCTANPGFYSFQHQKNHKNQKLKRKKLAWCNQLLNYFSNNYVFHITKKR